MIKVVEGYITQAKEKKDRTATLVVETLFHTDDRSYAEPKPDGRLGCILDGYESVELSYPDPKIGRIYLLTEDMLESLVTIYWERSTLIAHLGKEKAEAILGEADKREREQAKQKTAADFILKEGE